VSQDDAPFDRTDRLRSSDEPEDGPPPLAADRPLAPGYRVVAHLRRGEDLDVYDIWSEERACRCIAKVLRPDRGGERDARRRLLDEGRLLLRLTHPHIVRAYELQREPVPLLILETLPGETLAHLIDRLGRLPIRDAAHLGLHLCSAIGYLHRQGALHLDLKPSNVVASHGLAKVLDLSLARRPGRAGAGIGTPGYMAPEQVHGGDLGPATDVWGIGALLFEALTGQEPGEVDDADGGNQTDRPPEPIRRLRRLPADLAALVDACLDRTPDRRPPVAALSRGLARFV
jgi:eukaryotic-like serine/threonine-protein kinase